MREIGEQFIFATIALIDDNSECDEMRECCYYMLCCNRIKIVFMAQNCVITIIINLNKQTPLNHTSHIRQVSNKASMGALMHTPFP